MIVDSALDIQDVKIEGQKAQWDLGAKFEPYGNPLSIQVPNKQGDGVLLEIAMSTTRDCTALQWMTPAQTSNKKHPYMCKLFDISSVIW